MLLELTSWLLQGDGSVITSAATWADGGRLLSGPSPEDLERRSAWRGAGPPCVRRDQLRFTVKLSFEFRAKQTVNRELCLRLQASYCSLVSKLFFPRARGPMAGESGSTRLAPHAFREIAFPIPAARAPPHTATAAKVTPKRPPRTRDSRTPDL